MPVNADFFFGKRQVFKSSHKEFALLEFCATEVEHGLCLSQVR